MRCRLWIANGDLTFLKRVRSGDVSLVQPLFMRQSVSLSRAESQPLCMRLAQNQNQGMLVWRNLCVGVIHFHSPVVKSQPLCVRLT